MDNELFKSILDSVVNELIHSGMPDDVEIIGISSLIEELNMFSPDVQDILDSTEIKFNLNIGEQFKLNLARFIMLDYTVYSNDASNDSLYFMAA